MNKIFAILLAFSVSIAFAGERYKDRLFKVDVQKNVVVAKDVPQLSSMHLITTLLSVKAVKDSGIVAYFYNNETDTKNVDLLMDIYTPNGDDATDRAVVLVSHGGAFVAGAKDDHSQHTVNYCDSLAARGYVTASLEYRMGVTLQGKNNQLHIDSADFARTVYRGVQDIRSAIRYLRANHKKYGINPDKIYLLGNSAGAILSLEGLYAKAEDEFPEYINSKEPSLGTLDAYGDKTVYSQGNAAVALWGAVHNKDILKNSKAPVLLIHGTGDETVYFKTGRPLSNVAGVLKNIIPSDAGAALASLTLDLHAPTLYGSFVIDSVLTKLDVKHETYFVDGEPHEFYDNEKYTATVQKKVFDFLYSLKDLEPVGIEKKPLLLAKPSALRMGEGNLSFTLIRGENVRYAVYDLRGKRQMLGSVSAGRVVDLGSLENGVYILRVQGEPAVQFGVRR